MSTDEPQYNPATGLWHKNVSAQTYASAPECDWCGCLTGGPKYCNDYCRRRREDPAFTAGPLSGLVDTIEQSQREGWYSRLVDAFRGSADRTDAGRKTRRARSATPRGRTTGGAVRVSTHTRKINGRSVKVRSHTRRRR